jgi:plastocyanin
MRTAKLLLLGLSITLASARAAVVAGSDARVDPRAEARISLEKATVHGKISVAGSPQRAKPLPVFKNRSFCGATVRNETLLIGVEGGLQNAVIAFRPVGRKFSTPSDRLTLDNKHCAFAPHVQAATVGSELLLKNSDPILHTVHARLGKETLFNVGLPKWRQVTKRLDRPGVIRIDCDVLHTWMSAAIVVADTPFFAISDASGNFVIDSLVVGPYDMEIWHERLGTLRQRISIANTNTVAVDIVYSSENSR